ncbi:MAG: uridine kinase, partial [SAR324 cluster bacterium]
MKNSRSKPFVIGISGGSGSGKSTIINEIVERLGPEKIAVLHHDAYYRHRPELSFEERTIINFDHPDSLETKLLMKHLVQLISGEKVEVPIYDFPQHLRNSKTKKISPCQILIVDGILVLNDSQLCELMD